VPRLVQGPSLNIAGILGGEMAHDGLADHGHVLSSIQRAGLNYIHLLNRSCHKTVAKFQTQTAGRDGIYLDDAATPAAAGVQR